jgi:hypothetical protein
MACCFGFSEVNYAAGIRNERAGCSDLAVALQSGSRNSVKIACQNAQSAQEKLCS